MMLFRYLDSLPPIPDHLLENAAVDKIGFITKPGIALEATYARWAINEQLIAWLQKNISQVVDVRIVGLQRMTWDNEAEIRSVKPHCDIRQWAVNYIIEPGGPAVTTTFYKELGQPLLREPGTRISPTAELEIVESRVIEPRRWHILNTNVLHGVEHVQTQRQAITIGLNTDSPLDVIKGYTS